MPIEEVEPASEIVKRFATGAMSFGSISKEAHETLAIAMNRIGGRSNTGEGGEDEARFRATERRLGAARSSRWRRGRFGVTTNYLVNADELQIKIAQGAKPGEGGQLPGHKVDEVIARVRHSIPGVPLISPPPHHDIYSIEDLAQLIYDLKNVNPQARISVKLVAEVGVGTVAAGVAKAHADVVLISGHDGGTGASPLTSIKHAGIPWELGLAETQQVLVLNDLRSRIIVQTDGKLQTGPRRGDRRAAGRGGIRIFDGAAGFAGLHHDAQVPSEYLPGGHRDAGSGAAQKIHGQPEHVINYFFFVAEQVRQWMAKLGFRQDERHDRPRGQDRNARRGGALEGAGPRFFAGPVQSAVAVAGAAALRDRAGSRPRRRDRQQADRAVARSASTNGATVEAALPIRNVDRSVGAMLSGEIARRHGSKGLEPDTIHFSFHRIGGAELRGVSGARRDAGTGRRRERLRRQGAFGRQADRVSAARFDVRAGRKHFDRKCCFIRRDVGRGVLQRTRGRAIRGAQFRRDGGGRRRGRSRLRVHDQGPGDRAGRDREKISRRA